MKNALFTCPTKRFWLGVGYFKKPGPAELFYIEIGLEATFLTTLQNRNRQICSALQWLLFICQTSDQQNCNCQALGKRPKASSVDLKPTPRLLCSIPNLCPFSSWLFFLLPQCGILCWLERVLCVWWMKLPCLCPCACVRARARVCVCHMQPHTHAHTHTYTCSVACIRDHRTCLSRVAAACVCVCVCVCVRACNEPSKWCMNK